MSVWPRRLTFGTTVGNIYLPYREEKFVVDIREYLKLFAKVRILRSPFYPIYTRVTSKKSKMATATPFPPLRWFFMFVICTFLVSAELESSRRSSCSTSRKAILEGYETLSKQDDDSGIIMLVQEGVCDPRQRECGVTKPCANDVSNIKKFKDHGGLVMYSAVQDGSQISVDQQATRGTGSISKQVLNEDFGTAAYRKPCYPPGYLDLALNGYCPERGHLLAKSLGGSGVDVRNIATLMHHTNQAMIKYEKKIGAAFNTIPEHFLIHFSITLRYTPPQLYPAELRYETNIAGEGKAADWFDVVFVNTVKPSEPKVLIDRGIADVLASMRKPVLETVDGHSEGKNSRYVSVEKGKNVILVLPNGDQLVCKSVPAMETCEVK